MLAPDATRSAVVRMRRLRDLAGAAALGAVAVHTLLALARGWPRTPWLDAATADVVLGMFAVLVVLYAVRWFCGDEQSARRAASQCPRPAAWLSYLVRASGESIIAALVAGIVVGLQGEWSGSDAAVRAYYVALVGLASVRAIAARRRL
jgi:hypothetical protein